MSNSESTMLVLSELTDTQTAYTVYEFIDSSEQYNAITVDNKLQFYS